MCTVDKKTPRPGVSKYNRVSEESLQRLDNHLAAGTRISQQVLAQWIKRYGDAAREIIQRYGINTKDLGGPDQSGD